MIKTMLVAASLLTASITTSSALELSDLNQLIDQSTFSLKGCAATLIDVEKRHILTAEHCIRGSVTQVTEEEFTDDGKVKQVTRVYKAPLEVSQTFTDGSGNIVGSRSYRASIVKVDKKADLALLQVNGELDGVTRAMPVLPEGQEVVRGETIYILGNPGGLERTLTKGIASYVHRELQPFSGPNNAVKYIQVDGGSYFGNSGGSVFNEDGYLVGVLTLVHSQASHLGFAVSIENVRDFLKNPGEKEVHASVE